jgi:hypothetical protein
LALAINRREPFYSPTVLVRCWFGFFAVSCGVAVAWLVDGRSLPILWLVAVLGVLTAVTFAPQRLKTSPPPLFRRRPLPARPTVERWDDPAPFERPPVERRDDPAPVERPRLERRADPAPPPKPGTRSDQELVAELLSAVHPDDVAALRRQDFTGAWHSREIGPCERLLAVGSTLPRPSDTNLVQALHTLLVRTAAFLDYHDVHTVADPVTGSGEWRVVADVAPAGGNGGGASRSLAAELRERAAEVANAYEHLVITAARGDHGYGPDAGSDASTRTRGLLA